MAFRYFIRYLATSAWTFLVEFRNYLYFGSLLALLTSYLQLHSLCNWYMKVTRDEASCCLPGKKPWCYLGWINDEDFCCRKKAAVKDKGGESDATGAMAPTINSGCDPIKVKAVEGKKATPTRAKDADTKRFGPLVITLVGLPARGKTVAGLKLARYLRWSNIKTKVFSMSEYRRKLTANYGSHSMFSAENEEAVEVRRQSLTCVVEEATEWLQGGGDVAIIDGTMATREKRQWVHDHFSGRLGFKVLFIEFICDQEEVLTRNVKDILKDSPDYQDMSFERALDDFKQKVQHYVKVYQPMRSKLEPTLSFIKYVNEGEDISMHHVKGQLETSVLTYMTNYRVAPKTLYFSRHGESEYNVLGRIGGDTNLSPRGQLYGKSLARHINEAKIPGLRVWTSKLRRTMQTAHAVNAAKEALPALNELDAGVCEGLTYEEMAEKFPQEFAWRDQDKLRYRYPWGESYVDIMARVRPVLLELEAQDNILVVSHQAVLRCILGYLMDKTHEEVPYMDIPLHTIMKLTTNGVSYSMELIKIPVECVDTYRKQPINCSTGRSIEDALLTIPAHFEAHFDTNKMWQMMGSSSLLN